MRISQAQEEVARLFENIRHPRVGSFIALVEEVGEIADVVMKTEFYGEYGIPKARRKLASEMADVLVCLLELASVYGINLEEAFREKLLKLEEKVPKWEREVGDVLREKRERMD